MKNQKDHKNRGHHAFGMSKLGAYRACSAYLNKDGGTNEAAEDGTRQHETMDKVADLLKEWLQVMEEPVPLDAMVALEQVLADNPDDVYSDEEFFALVFCCKEINKWTLSSHQVIDIHNEISVELPDIYSKTGEVLNFGSLDLLIVFDGNIGVLIDYKFGYLPVTHAKDNAQAWGYALGCFREFPELKRIIPMIVQPKLHSATSGRIDRKDVPKLGAILYDVVTEAQKAHKLLEAGKSEEVTFKSGDHCAYCARKGTCPAKAKSAVALANHQRELAYKIPSLPDFTALKTPEDYAKVLYALKDVEDALDQIKESARDMAEANDGILEFNMPNVIDEKGELVEEGELVRYKLSIRNGDRVVAPPSELIDAMASVGLDEKALLSACTITIGKIEQMAGPLLMELNNGPLDDELAAIEQALKDKVEHKELTKTAAKKELAAFKREQKENRLNKATSKEQLNALLETNGLISQGDGQVRSLRRDKSQTKKQIEK